MVMPPRCNRFFLKVGLAALVLGLLGACFSSIEKRQMEAAAKAAEKRDFPQAIELYRRVMRGSPRTDFALTAARSGVKIAETNTKDFQSMTEFLSFIILNSSSAEERKQAQTTLADVFFNRMNDYSSAIVEYNKLLSLELSPEEAVEIRLTLAKGYFFLNNFDQAKTELAEILKKKLDPEIDFQVGQLRGNIAMAQKNFEDAIKHFSDISVRFPSKAILEKVGLSLSVCYEERNDLANAIQVLEKMKAPGEKNEFLDSKIQRLQERRAMLPGARGLKK